LPCIGLKGFEKRLLFVTEDHEECIAVFFDKYKADITESLQLQLLCGARVCFFYLIKT
jgi:hypothetical protein